MQAAKAREEPVTHTTFIPYESIKVFEQKIDDAFGSRQKRTRQAALRQLIRVLRELGLVPPNLDVKALAFGTLEATGERGLFVLFEITTQVRNLSLPGNYAEERRKARNKHQLEQHLVVSPGTLVPPRGIKNS